MRAGQEERAPVAGALEGHRQRAGGPRAHVVERELDPPLDEPADLEPPGSRVDRGDVEVDQEIVEARRRDRLTQDLERKRVVARGESKLVEGDAGLGLCDVDTHLLVRASLLR